MPRPPTRLTLDFTKDMGQGPLRLTEKLSLETDQHEHMIAHLRKLISDLEKSVQAFGEAS